MVYKYIPGCKITVDYLEGGKVLLQEYIYIYTRCDIDKHAGDVGLHISLSTIQLLAQVKGFEVGLASLQVSVCSASHVNG